MTDPQLAAVLAPLEGQWKWRFLEDVDATPICDPTLSVKGGEVTEAGKLCYVTTTGDEVKVRLVDRTCEVRFKPTGEDEGEIEAQFWVLAAPTAEDDAEIALDALMEFEELAVLIRLPDDAAVV